MKLIDILKGVNCEIKGDPNIDIGGVCYDSRKAKKKYLFIAIKGFKTDGILYVEEAIKNKWQNLCYLYAKSDFRKAK
jgi:UDP-N-acetylmuramoyl-L-alanyl-D-glutamate--2,6-diaminopimelate ligase